MMNTSGDKQPSTAVKVAIIGGCFTVIAAVITAIAAIASGAWVLYKEPISTSSAPDVATAPAGTQIRVDGPDTHSDTPAGSILTPGDVWYQGGMEMRVKKTSFVPGCNGILGFEVTIMNNTGGEIVTNISGLDISVADNAGINYSEIFYDYGVSSENCYYGGRLKDLSIIAMKAGDRVDLAVRVLGDAPSQASQMIVTAYKVGRIENAKWVITIPK